MAIEDVAITLKADLDDDGSFETDWSTYLRSFTTDVRRATAIDRFGPRRASFILDNTDSRFSPRNAAGPYSPNLSRGKRVRLSAQITTPAVENLVDNPSFETNTTGWAKGTGNGIAVSTVEARFGKTSLKCTWQTGGDPELAKHIITLTAAAYVGSVYVWIPSDWDGGDIQVLFQDFASATGLATGTADSSITDQWQRVEATVTPDAGDLVGSFDVKAASNPSNGKFIYIDAATVQTGSVAGIYVDGDQPTCTWSGAVHGSTSDRAVNPTVNLFTGELREFNIGGRAQIPEAEFVATGLTEGLLRTLISAGPFTRVPAQQIAERVVDIVEGLFASDKGLGGEAFLDGAMRYGADSYAALGGSTLTEEHDTGESGNDPVVYDALEGDNVLKIAVTGDGEGWEKNITADVVVNKPYHAVMYLWADDAVAAGEDVQFFFVADGVPSLATAARVTLIQNAWVRAETILMMPASFTTILLRTVLLDSASPSVWFTDCVHLSEAFTSTLRVVTPTFLGTKWETVLEYIDAFDRSAGDVLSEVARSVGGWMYETGDGDIVLEDYSQRDPAVVGTPKLRLSDVPEEGFAYLLTSYSEPAASLAGLVIVGSFGEVTPQLAPPDERAKIPWTMEPIAQALGADEERTFLAAYATEGSGRLILRRAVAFALPLAGWATVDGVATPLLKNYGRSGAIVIKAPGGGQTVEFLQIGARIQNRETSERAFVSVGSGQPIMELDMPGQGFKTTAMTNLATWAHTKYNASPATMETTLVGASVERLLEIFGHATIGLPVWVRHVQGPGHLSVDALFYTEGTKIKYVAGRHPRLTLFLEEG